MKKLMKKHLFIPGRCQIKEAAVVMIVDGIEAASSSLKEKTLKISSDLINNMIDQKIKDKQLDRFKINF